MPQKMNGKQKMYDFEKIALVIAFVLTVAIVLLVVFATKGTGRTPSQGSSEVVHTPADKSGDPESADSTVSVPEPEIDIEFTTVKLQNTGLDEGDLILVNQTHEYKKDVEDKLVNVYSYNSDLSEASNNWYGLTDVSQKLRKEVVDALNDMYKDYYSALAKADVIITKTYVSSSDQQAEYDRISAGADAEDKAYMQAGGYSEHQTGLAFNLRNGDDSWFNDNCWRYGFIPRYPAGKESITYVKDETNHYRYVGVSHALYMKLNKFVLEEYLGLLETKTYTSRLKLDDGTSSKYEVYAVKAANGAETEVPVPAEGSGWTYSVSGTNTGYFIVTICKGDGAGDTPGTGGGSSADEASTASSADSGAVE